ncbi:hypothetical protein [Acinetobacter puyangensis]|uniref:hypothetical protein n=1 Tax=Acinetobacter puyangensis TaxID=1096779 RepID=UPI003A4D6CCA
MKFDFSFNLISFKLIVLLTLIVLFAHCYDGILTNSIVRIVEDGQAIFLFAAAIFTWCYVKQNALSASKRSFRIWAMIWWMVLFGRSISWGRDYFPLIPHPYFRMVSIVMIAPLVLMLLSRTLRQEIIHKLKYILFPFWYLLIALLSVCFADSIEHHRFIDHFLLHNVFYQDLVEELYEIPFMLALFMAAYSLMQKDKKDMSLFATGSDYSAKKR